MNAPRLNNTEFIVQISAEQNEYVSSADECQFLAGFVWILRRGQISEQSLLYSRMWGKTDTCATLAQRRNLISHLLEYYVPTARKPKILINRGKTQNRRRWFKTKKRGLRRFFTTDYDEDKLVQFGLSCMVVSLISLLLRRRCICCCATLIFQVNTNDQKLFSQ